MGRDNLLAIRRDQLVQNVNSHQRLRESVNRAYSSVLQGTEQPWIIDIKCLGKSSGRYYLAVMFDAVSNGIIGWALDRTIEDAVGKAAVRSALLQQPYAIAGASYEPQNPLLGPLRRLASTAQDY